MQHHTQYSNKNTLHWYFQCFASVVEDNALNLPQTTRKGSSMHAIETGDRPKSSHTSIRVNFSGKKGTCVYIYIILCKMLQLAT